MTGDTNIWEDRVVSVLSGSGESDVVIDELLLLTLVGARYAAQFEIADRWSVGGEPAWHEAVREAIASLVKAGMVTRASSLRLTATGTRRVRGARQRADSFVPERTDTRLPVGRNPLPVAGVIAPALRTEFEAPPPKPDVQSALESVVAEPQLAIMVELNLRFDEGPAAAFDRLKQLWKLVDSDGDPYRLADEYATGQLTAKQIEGLVAADAVALNWPDRAIYRIWPDFEVRQQIDYSSVTIKAEAAQRSFNSYGEGIVWAIVDSGIDEHHPHFAGNHTLSHDSVSALHRVFTGTSEPIRDGALSDELGHGTHVAGIVAGGLEMWSSDTKQVVVTEERYNAAAPKRPTFEPREVRDVARLAGMAPLARLVSLKVLGAKGSETARVGRVIQALAYVRGVNATSDKLPRIHGVNLSLGYDFDAQWFACGRSPLCLEVDKLVRTGVVVVVAAGNSGYGTISPTFESPSRFSVGMTINDPGNAQRAITVGSTHRDSPHTFGVSYFSSRGPTGDGRRKPDLVAPGERIASAAAGELREQVLLTPAQANAAVYVESSGTSMAAPHVSGAIAAFLSVRREFIGDPDAVKRVFVDAATPLGRDADFEGGGLVDLMRALQAV